MVVIHTVCPAPEVRLVVQDANTAITFAKDVLEAVGVTRYGDWAGPRHERAAAIIATRNASRGPGLRDPAMCESALAVESHEPDGP